MLNTDLQAIFGLKNGKSNLIPLKQRLYLLPQKPILQSHHHYILMGKWLMRSKVTSILVYYCLLTYPGMHTLMLPFLRQQEGFYIMRSLKYLLSRRALEQIYFVFIRPIIEYGDVLYDGCGLMNGAKLNKVQYEAAKIVSSAMHGTSYDLLLQDLGWEPLKSSRERHKLCLFYDFMNGNCPLHMLALLPDNITHNYQIRDPKISSILARTNKYYNSFIPSSIRLWYSLDIAIKQSDTLASFKAKLCQQTKPQKNFLLLSWAKVIKCCSDSPSC